MIMQTKNIAAAISLLMVFALWTAVVGRIDVQTINPKESAAGFAALNSFLQRFAGVYLLTDIIGGALLSAGLQVLYCWLCGLK